MIKLELLLAFILITLCSFGQDDNINNIDNKGESNIYFQAIKESLSFIKTKGFPKDTLFLEEDYKLTTNILPSCAGTSIILLDPQKLWEKVSMTKAIDLYRIYPLSYSEGEFFISIVPYAVSLNKEDNTFRYIYAGGYKVLFKFDGKKFVFEKVIQHSI